MARKKTYFCQECGHRSPRWLGKCPECQTWNSMTEEEWDNKGLQGQIHVERVSPQPITAVAPIGEERFSLGIPEFDRVMGGGVVPGSLILLGGDPGIGKSTILLQVAAKVAATLGKILYVSGEESLSQVRLRGERLGILEQNVYLVSETEITIIEKYIRELDPKLVIIDSIQTMFYPETSSAPGSVSQVRDCTARLIKLAKNSSASIVVVGHVTKEGMLAGPRVLEHMVDVVLYLEGQRHQGFRLLRGVKNRYGSTNEVGVFEMRGSGLIEVPNPSALFMMAHTGEDVPGAVVVPTMEGTRPLLVEIQALVCSSGYGVPRRMTTGVDHNRVALIMAVLEKRVGMQMGNSDAYVNVVGGVKIDEPAVDLGIAVALASSFRDCPVESRLAVMGEIGLTGEIRSITGIERRIGEAKHLGFGRCLVPAADARLACVEGIEVDGVRTVAGAIERALKV